MLARMTTGDLISEIAAKIVAEIRAQQAADPRIAVSRKDAQTMLGIGASRLIELENEGELHSYLDGAARRIVVASVYGYAVRRAIAAHPAGSPAQKARQPSAR
jgi:hypothetical protein